MLTTSVVLALLAVQLVAAQYKEESEPSEKTWKESESKKSESTEEEKPGPEYYDEVYAANANGQVYAVTALNGENKWSEPQQLDDSLYNAQGVTICNNGELDAWGRWQYVYVADAGDAENKPAVYQYNVVRSAEEPGKIELDMSSKQVVYGGEEVEEEVEPTDVQCDKKGLVIADAKHGVVFKEEKKVANVQEKGNAWVQEECEQVQEVKKSVEENKKADAKIQSIAVDNDNVYFAVNAEEGNDKNAVWKQKKSKSAECDDVEEVAQDAEKKGAYGVAWHNDQVLFTTGGGKVWSEKGDEWASGYEQAGYIASAGERGLLVADHGEGAVYVSKGKGEANKIADIDAAYGVAYYAGQKWEPAAEEEESSSSLALGAAALVGAAAML